MTKTYKVNGNTYNARNLLKDCGFAWDAPSKTWYGDEDAYTELRRVSTATYSRGNQKLVAGLKITELENSQSKPSENTAR